MADKKPEIIQSSTKGAWPFGTTASTSSIKNMFSSNKEQNKQPGSMLSQPSNQNQKEIPHKNIFRSESQPSGTLSIFNKPEDTANKSSNKAYIFAKEKTEEGGSETEQKTNQKTNPFAKFGTISVSNLFANKQAIKPEEQTSKQMKADQSNQSNQSNIFAGVKNESAKNSFSLSQQNPQSVSPESNLFVPTHESKPGALSGANINDSIKVGLFATSDKKQTNNKELFETMETLESNTQGKQELTKNSQEIQRQSKQHKNEQQKKLQQKEPGNTKIIDWEKSQEEKCQNSQLPPETFSQASPISKEFVNYMKEKKKNGQKIRLPGYKEYRKKKNQILKSTLEKQKQQNEELSQKSLRLEKEKNEKQEKLKKLQAHSLNELSYKKIIEVSEQNNPTKKYPEKDLILKEIKDLTTTIQSYYFPSVSQNLLQEESSNPQTQLINLGEKIKKANNKKEHQVDMQKLLISENAENLQKIQSRQMFGGYIKVDENLSEKEVADLNGMRQILEGQLKRLREENSQKKKRYDTKKAQLKEFSPPKKMVEGRSSIIMSSTIFQ